MKKKTMYECPTCHKMWSVAHQALRCRSEHEIGERTVYMCEICRKVWNPESVVGGAVVAAEEARECERNHNRRGDTDSDRKLYFESSGGKGKFHVISMVVTTDKKEK